MPKIAEEARAARRGQIIAAAAECFARSGYHVTTMTDIAAAAGVSKEKPVPVLPQQGGAVHRAVRGMGLRPGRPGRRGDGGLAEPAIAAKVQAANAVSLDQLTGLFAAGAAAEEWPPGTDPALRARLFTAVLYGLMAQWHTGAGSFSLDTAMMALAAHMSPGGHETGNEAEEGGT